MKKHGAVYLFLGILEGMVSGVFAFLAGEEKEDKIFNYLASAVFFLDSLIHVHLGMDSLWPKGEDAGAEEAEDF